MFPVSCPDNSGLTVRIRRNTHMIGISVGTLRNWEQGRRYPEGLARALLKIAAENPEVFEKALV